MKDSMWRECCGLGSLFACLLVFLSATLKADDTQSPVGLVTRIQGDEGLAPMVQRGTEMLPAKAMMALYPGDVIHITAAEQRVDYRLGRESHQLQGKGQQAAVEAQGGVPSSLQKAYQWAVAQFSHPDLSARRVTAMSRGQGDDVIFRGLSKGQNYLIEGTELWLELLSAQSVEIDMTLTVPQPGAPLTGRMTFNGRTPLEVTVREPGLYEYEFCGVDEIPRPTCSRFPLEVLGWESARERAPLPDWAIPEDPLLVGLYLLSLDDPYWAYQGLLMVESSGADYARIIDPM